MEKYNVIASEPKYIAVNGILAGEMRGLIYGTGPCNAAKLPSTTIRRGGRYLHKKRTLPTVHRMTNFRGFKTSTGINTKAITKHAAAPRTQHPNTISRSH